ncbi:MAG: ABC transporter substrate-binding protein [Anaerolineae bacterium]
MKRSLWTIFALAAVIGMILTACAQPTPQVVEKEVTVKETVVVEKEVEVPVAPAGSVIVFGVWSGADELPAFEQIVAPFSEETGIVMSFLGTRDLPTVLTTRVEAGNPPDVAILPNPGQVAELAELGALVDLSTFLDMDTLLSEYGQSWIDVSSVEGALVSVFFKPSYKSLVWYNPKAFEAAGYEVPTTWDELIALSDQMVADGGTPWCVGFESGAASGWPGTDWIEDIMLRTAGPDVYDQWVAHEIPWIDPAVRTAWETFGEIVTNEAYLFGGTTGVLATNFGDSPAGLFTDPPGCYLHKQASFVPVFFPEGVVAGEDYNFFPFPEIDPAYGTPALTAGDFIVVFNDTPQARALVEYLASAEAQELAASVWPGFVSANREVSLDAYPDALTRQIGEALTSAKVARFDGGDAMPAAVGSGSFWTGVLDYVGGKDLDTVLTEIEATAVDAYGE